MDKKDFTGAGFDKNCDSKAGELKEPEAITIKDFPEPDYAFIAHSVLHKAETRGYANHGWLISYQTFSFADYYNPERLRFGVLRVLNDDWVAPAMGFGNHPHDNMEIVSIPLDGALEHTDNINNKTIIQNGDIQLMSAGTGIFHAEYNKSNDRPVSFLQIWLFPKKKNLSPRYDQKSLNLHGRRNTLLQIVSPCETSESVRINQDAWFHIGTFDRGISIVYNLKKAGNGVYFFVIKGAVTIHGQPLEKRDGLGTWNNDRIVVQITGQDTEILVMEVPMNID